MTPVLLTAAVALVTGVAAALVAARRRGPVVADETVRTGLRAHPALARWLRRRPAAAPLTGAALALASALGAAALVGVGLVHLMVRTDRGLARSDEPLARWARDNTGERAGDVLSAVTDLGGTVVVVAVAVVVAVIGARRADWRNVAGFVATTVLGQLAVVNSIKWIIDRARPDLAQLTGHAGASFPSGHSASAAATWACVALILGRGRSKPVRAALAGGAVAIATAVATTRVFLGVHWFTDVVAGLLLGWGWFATCSIAFGGRELQFGRPVKRAEDLAGTTRN